MIDFFMKGGILMWPILMCSVVALALTIAKSLQFWGVLRRLSVSSSELLKEKPPEMASIVESILQGLDEKQVSFMGSRKVRELEKGLGVLSLVATVAPLLGFTGTVIGMIQAFMVIAEQTGARVDPSMVAGGIYEALITTAGGLLVAIPTHIALHFLEARLDEISMRMKGFAITLYEGVRNGV